MRASSPIEPTGPAKDKATAVHDGVRFPSRVAALLLGAALSGGCASPPVAVAPGAAATAQASADVRRALAPTGTLRIAVYPGSPTSLVRQSGSGEVRGMSVDIGRELASRLGVPARIVELEGVEQAVEALRTAQADVTVTNATATRARRWSISPSRWWRSSWAIWCCRDRRSCRSMASTAPASASA